MVKVFCDGGSRGNPGPAAVGFVVVQDGEIVLKRSKYLGKATNNVAEYTAVILALQYLRRLQVTKDVHFVMDSQLVVRQLNGEYKVKDENLKKLYLQVKGLEKRFNEPIDYKWLSRKRNDVADSLVNIELDKQLL